MDNSRKHDSIGTKTHRTAPSSSETSASEHHKASANATSTEHLQAAATTAGIMASANPAMANSAAGSTQHSGGGAINETSTPNLSSTAVATPATSNATSSNFTNNSASTTYSSSTALVPKPSYSVTPSQFTQPPAAASAAPGAASASGGGGAHASTSTGSSQSSTKTVQRPAVFDKVSDVINLWKSLINLCRRNFYWWKLFVKSIDVFQLEETIHSSTFIEKVRKRGCLSSSRKSLEVFQSEVVAQQYQKFAFCNVFMKLRYLDCIGLTTSSHMLPNSSIWRNCPNFAKWA